MLKKLLTLSLVFVGVLALAACNPTPDGPTDLEKIAEALVEIELPSEASSDLTFPSTGLHDVTITWESDNTDVIANDGTVTIPTKTMGDKTVKITAFVTIGENTLTKTFDVKVLAATAYTDAEKVEQAKNALLLADTIVISDITLVATSLDADVTWSSSNTDYIANDGTVTRPDQDTGNVSVTLTATLTVGDATATKEFTITVQAEEAATVYTSIATMYNNAILDDYIEFTGIVTGVFDGGYFLSDGTHSLGIYAGNNDLNPAIGDEVKVRGFYAVYNTLYQLGSIVSEEVLSTGNANPLTAEVKTVAQMLALDSSDPTIHGMYYTVTGTIELRGSYDNVYLVEGDDALLVYYYSLEDSIAALEAQVGKEVTITVFYYTNHGTNGPMVAYDGGEAGITIVELPASEALAADIAALPDLVPGITLETITLPTEGPNGTVFSAWTSSDTAVMGDDGTFVAVGATSVTITFTGTATKGDLTETVTVDVVVPLNSTVAEVLAMEEDAYFQVTGVIYEMSYYGFFIEQGGDFIFVYYKQYDGPAVVGDEITVLGMRDEYSGLAQVALQSDITINSSGNAVPTAVNSTVSALQNDLVPRGTTAIVTGMVSLEGKYDTVTLTDVAGGVIEVYYRSNADEIGYIDDKDNDDATDDEVMGFVGKIITLEVVTYQNGSVLYQGVAADITEETAYTDAYTAQAVADFIDLGNVAAVEADITLPTTNGSATIAWATSDAAVITDAGVITRVAGATPSATLTATVTFNAEVVTRDIVVTLVDLNDNAPINVSEALALTDGETPLVTGIITGKYYDERVIQDITTGVGIYVDEDIEGEIGDIIIVRGELVTYTGNDNNRREIEYHSYLETVSTGNALIIDAETDPAVIADEFAEMRTYTATLTFKEADSFGYLFFNGSATRDIKFSDFYAPYFTDVYNVGDTVEVTFTVMDIHFGDTRVVNVTMPELTDAQKVTAAKAGLEVSASTTSDLTLPTELYGATIAWASDSAALTDMGVVTRPANGDGDATVNLTATITAGVETDTKAFVVTVPEQDPPADPLFISEYAEGSSNNKYIEIYNPNAFDVVMNGYKVCLYSNGASECGNNIELDGITIGANDVYVISNADAALQEILDASDTTSNITWFNGDDAVALLKDGVVIDVIGEIGVDPGSEWTVGVDSTKDHTLVRKATVTAGVTTFDPNEWDTYAQNDNTNVGSHTTS